MRTKTDSRRTRERQPPRNACADEILEFVFNDEEEALWSEHIVLSHQRDLPALQEFLQQNFGLDTRRQS